MFIMGYRDNTTNSFITTCCYFVMVNRTGISRSCMEHLSKRLEELRPAGAQESQGLSPRASFLCSTDDVDGRLDSGKNKNAPFYRSLVRCKNDPVYQSLVRIRDQGFTHHETEMELLSYDGYHPRETILLDALNYFIHGREDGTMSKFAHDLMERYNKEGRNDGFVENMVADTAWTALRGHKPRW